MPTNVFFIFPGLQHPEFRTRYQAEMWAAENNVKMAAKKVRINPAEHQTLQRVA